MLVTFLYLSAYVLRILAWLQEHPDLYTAYQIFLSANFVLVTICILPFLSIMYKFGVLVVTMESMV